MEKQHIKLPLCMLFVLIPCLCFPIQTNASDLEEDEEQIEIIVTSSSTKYIEEKDNYQNSVVSSISENAPEKEKEEKQTKEVELLNEELEIKNLNNLVVNNSDTKLFIYESENEDSEKLGFLMPDAVGEAEDLRKFDSELDRFIAGDAEWLFIDSGNISGYIKNEDLLQGKNAVNELNSLYNTKAKVTANKVYVRREPSKEADSITFLRYGAYVKVNIEELEFEMDEEGNELLPDWIPVIVDDEEGFISSELITLVNSVDYAMKYVKPETNTYSGGAKIVIPPTEETPSAVVDFALQFLGCEYQWGGSDPLNGGADCSGFVMYVYKYFGVSLPHYSYSDRFVGRAVEYDEIQPGDIVVYDGHVGIYAGNGQIVNALNKKNGITLTDVNYDTVLAVRRVLE